MGVTLNNTGDSGSVNLTLSAIQNYTLESEDSYAVKDVPGKTTSTIDTDTVTKRPRILSFEADVTSAQLTSLETLYSERKNIAFTDGGYHSITVRMTRPRFISNDGNDNQPFRAFVQLIEKE